MTLRPRRLSWLVCTSALIVACGPKTAAGGLDANGDLLADDLGHWVDANKDDASDTIDINRDGTPDGPGIDTNGDGKVDALALDLNCDGIYDAYDTDGDGEPNFTTGKVPVVETDDCHYNTVSHPNNVGGSTGMGGSGAGGSGMMGGSGTHTGGSGGSSSMAGSGGGAMVAGQLGKGAYQGTGESSDQYAQADVSRSGVDYMFIANGWGMGWQSHDISWNGTSFTVLSLNGSQGSDYSPAGYPSVFCGLYSKKQSTGSCGLPATITSLKSVKTGWRWDANGNSGQYNAAWDIWLGNGGNLSAYLMVWLRDPPGQQPAGAGTLTGATLTGLPGTWTIWTGNVKGIPIVNYVRAEGQDLPELEFDVLDVYRDVQKHNYNLPGSQLLAVAVGFEVWNGPIKSLKTNDFYVDVK